MIRWISFPKNRPLPAEIRPVIDVFQRNESVISSANFLKSNEVLEALRPDLTEIGFSVEAGYRKQDKIRVPVLFGEQGSEELAFEADGYCPQRRMVLEIEAGRGVTNNQFLKDFFEACMMVNVDWFCVAVRQVYRGNRDYEKVRDFFDAMYLSGRIQTELSGVLVIGY